MGCDSSQIAESNRVVPLPPEATNSYLDKFPAIILQKIKQKFDSLCEKQTKDLMIFNFVRLYSRAKLTPQFMKRLLTFFYDNQNNNIKFRHFIVKYATLTKCEAPLFYRILFEIYKNVVESDSMGIEEFHNFLRNESKYFEKMPLHPQFPMNLEQFVEILGETGFNAKEYQARLSITGEEDVPFKTINQQLFQCEMQDFVVGREYYLLSNAWYYRWSFYYLDIDHEQYKSTKFISEDSAAKRQKRREPTVNQRRSQRTGQMENALIQQPRIIDFEDVQGQYLGQLKENINIASQIKVISENVWNLLCSLHTAEQLFKRPAISANRLEYYTKAVYYLETDESGRIVVQSQHVEQLSLSFKVAAFRRNKDSPRMGIFTKNFGEKNWREVDDRRVLAQVSLDPRFLIALAYNREKFIDKMFRKEILKENFQPGDQVFTYFPFIKAPSQATIISLCENNSFKVHFKGFSYKYQIKVNREDLSVMQSEAVFTSSKRKYESLIKGIPNIGNTCFMNSIIQCLVATPILDNFLLEFPFDKKMHPIGYGLSRIAKSLLKNENPEPQQFKRIIDVEMPSFSGYHQQDAQEFLNLLLDTINEQLKEKPTVIDYLFGGKIQSRLTCRRCSNIKHIEQKMYILSLPIPESQYNYFSIIIVPVASRTMRKVIFKLHKNATISEYCNAFEQRSCADKRNYIFAQTSYNSLKKVKTQITNPEFQRKKVTELGITSTDALIAFEKLPIKVYYDLLASKPQNPFRDFQPNPSAGWTICKIMSTKIEKNMIALEYLTQHYDIERMKVDKDTAQFAKLGSMTELLHSKIVLRKYNIALKRLENFGMDLLFSIPKWASYDELIKLVEKYTQNLKTKEARLQRRKGRERGDYLIRLIDDKHRCVFCLKEIQQYQMEIKEISHCCDVLQSDIPLSWVAKKKNYSVYMDWIDFSKCNSMFCSYIQVDQVSRSVEIARQQQFISLQTCMKLYSQAEVVEMQCEKCKEKHQNLEHLIQSMPNILVVHMKEFRYTPEGHLIKLDLRLKWQQFLDSSKYSFTSNGKLYELFSLVKHSGSSQSGHYTCIAKRKHPFENKKVWVFFDDQSGQIMKQQQSIIDDAYLLLYKKVDMPTSALVLYSDLAH